MSLGTLGNIALQRNQFQCTEPPQPPWLIEKHCKGKENSLYLKKGRVLNKNLLE